MPGSPLKIKEEPEVVLRRTHSFEADEKGVSAARSAPLSDILRYSKYLNFLKNLKSL